MASMAMVAGASAVTVTGLVSKTTSASHNCTPACRAPFAPPTLARTFRVARRTGLRIERAVASRASSDDTATVVTVDEQVTVVAASSSDEAAAEVSKDVNQILADLQTKWEAVENKPTVALYAGGALVTLWLSSTIIGAVNSIPLLPKLLELVGLGYTGWFVYRYLLFKSSRKELVTDIEDLKAKITGATSSITGPGTDDDE